MNLIKLTDLQAHGHTVVLNLSYIVRMSPTRCNDELATLIVMANNDELYVKEAIQEIMSFIPLN